jgi:aspartate/methionine/tyrosine aminotransferase
LKPLSATALALPRSGIRIVMERAASLTDVIHLEVGEPDVNTPEPIIDAAFMAARAGFTKYTPNAGLGTLRSAIAAKLGRVNGLDRSPDNVVVTAGAVAALVNTVLAAVNPGDEVLVPDPGWPNYRAMVQLAGGEVVPYRLRRDAGYLPDFEDLDRLVTPATKLLITNSPGNPTGGVFPASIVENLVRFAEQNDLYLLADEVYEEFVYEGNHVSAGRFDSSGRVIVVSGFSKTYAMTGWRLGYAVANPDIAKLIAKLAEPLVSCASSVSQKAAEAALALDGSAVDSMRQAYRGRRDAAVAILEQAGLLASYPSGAFYALVDLRSSGLGSDELAWALLDEERVATAPGSTFGASTEGMVRISFATNTEDLVEGCARIVRFAARHRLQDSRP